MKKILTVSILVFFTIFNTKIYSTEFDIKANTVILQDFLSGKILYQKEPDLKIFPASMISMTSPSDFRS